MHLYLHSAAEFRRAFLGDLHELTCDHRVIVLDVSY